MKNCLVTELTGRVNGNDHYRLGEMRFDIINSSHMIEVAFDYGNTNTIYTDDGTTFDVYKSGSVVASGVTTYTFFSEWPQTLEIKNFSKTGIVWITNKKGFRNLIVDLADFDARQLEFTPIYKLDFTNFGKEKYKTSDIDFSNMTSYKDSTYNIIGKLADLGYAVNLAEFGFAGGIKGDILELAIAQIKNGRTSATISGTGWSRAFNGTNIGSYSNYQISWVQSGANYVVTCKAGTTIESPSFNESVTVNAQGNIVS